MTGIADLGFGYLRQDCKKAATAMNSGSSDACSACSHDALQVCENVESFSCKSTKVTGIVDLGSGYLRQDCDATMAVNSGLSSACSACSHDALQCARMLNLSATSLLR